MSIRMVVVGVVFAACGGGEGAPDAPIIDAVPCPAGTELITATARGYGTSINGALDGTVVCVHGRADIPCKQSVGSFLDICRPTGVDVALRASKFGWQSAISLYPPDVPGLFTEISDDAFANLVWEDIAGGMYPSTTEGYVLAFICDTARCPDTGMMDTFSGIADAQIAIDPIKAPVYANPDQIPDPMLTMTSSSGIAYFPNVAPGMVDITVTAPGFTSCRQHDRASGRGGGWTSPVAGASTRVPVVAGTLTSILLRCTP